MGIILDEYYGYKEEYREYISKRAYRLLEMTKNEKIELKPNQQLALNINDYNFIKRTVVGHDYSAWTQGKLVFRNAPLNEIIMTLNRRFNVKIESQPSTLSLNSKYIATFDQTQSLDEILNILSYQQKWRYVIDKGVYRITLK